MKRDLTLRQRKYQPAVARTTQYEYGDPPELLAPLDAAVMRLMQAIVACEEGLVDYPDGCTPWARF